MTLCKNMGGLDRGLRLLVAVLIALLLFTDQVSGLVAIILGILAAVFVVTSLLGTCPLYLPFGLSTDKE